MTKMPKADVAGPTAFALVDELLGLLLDKKLITADEHKALLVTVTKRKGSAASEAAADFVKRKMLP